MSSRAGSSRLFHELQFSDNSHQPKCRDCSDGQYDISA